MNTAGDYSPSSNYQFALNNKSRQGLGFGTANSALDLPLNRWTHLAATFDGSTYRVYIDGLLVTKETGTMRPPVTAPLIIGGSGDCAGFTGLVEWLKKLLIHEGVLVSVVTSPKGALKLLKNTRMHLLIVDCASDVLKA